MIRRRFCRVRKSRWLFIAALALWGPVATADDSELGDEAKRTGLVETSEARLAQIDVTVIGPPEVVAALTKDDFTVKINLKKLPEFELDRVGTCASPENGTDPTARAATVSGSYLFYFDQPLMTMEGRQRSLDQARELIRLLVIGGNRAAILSNARRLIVVEPFTSDAQRLLDALDRLEHDRTQWDTYAEQEENRVAEIVWALNQDNNLQHAIGLARVYQKEETWRTQRSLRRLKLALGQLVDSPSPRTVVYFSDSLRANAGEHYLSAFGRSMQRTDTTLAVMATDSTTAVLPFDALVNESSALGVRFYPVQAQGLVSRTDSAVPTASAMELTGGGASLPRLRVNDAQRTLQNLAAETGGYAFLNGVGSEKIARRIGADTSCLFMISFDPTKFRKDVALRTVVKVDRPDVKVRSRGRTVVQSASTQRTSRILRAFGSPGAIEDSFDVQANLVPTGFDGGSYSALVQVSVPGLLFQDTSWDLGVSVVREDKIREASSGRISVSGPGVPVVYEFELTFKPGFYELVSVAHESATGLIASNQSRVEWPSVGGAVGPIALLQPSAGAFLRDDQTRLQGSLARAPEHPVLTELPTAFVGLVCRGKKPGGRFEVERSLVGNSTVDFDPLSFDLKDARCAQVRDVVSANTLRAGYYHYDLRVSRDGEPLNESRREFVAVGPDP
jgi:VWFA-related protein